MPIRQPSFDPNPPLESLNMNRYRIYEMSKDLLDAALESLLGEEFGWHDDEPMPSSDPCDAMALVKQFRMTLGWNSLTYGHHHPELLPSDIPRGHKKSEMVDYWSACVDGPNWVDMNGGTPELAVARAVLAHLAIKAEPHANSNIRPDLIEVCWP
jgi:hypothetical protein